MEGKNFITLAHGSGGTLTHRLVKDVFRRRFENEHLSPLLDSALIGLPAGRIAFTTDSYVIKPLKFPGGDIGKLAICGTVNDLAVCGAVPKYISCGFIIEEGLDIALLDEIACSMERTARDAGVLIVTGDTKVVEKGSGDGVFINTSGIGIVPDGVVLGYDSIAPGDRIIVSGNIAEHGFAVLAAREGLALESPIESDCAPLNGLIASLLNQQTANCELRTIKFMRDPTRGGIATTLCEIAESTGLSLEIAEAALPVSEGVLGISEILGIDPLYSANEGKVLIVASQSCADAVLAAMRSHPLASNAAIIGSVTSDKAARVVLNTEIGTHRQITMLTGNQLPRIC